MSDHNSPELAGEARVCKVDTRLGLVFGYAVVCKIDGKPYFDLNIDKAGSKAGQRVPEHITEEAMLKAASAFAMSARAGNDMHRGPEVGTYAFLFPLTEDIAKAMGITTRKTGLMVAYKPPPEILAKYESGEYTGFSIEGSRIKSEEIE